VTDDICNGNTYIFPDGTSQTITSFTSYQITYTSTNGCDSIVTYDITPLPLDNVTINDNICSGGSYTFPDGTSQTITTNTTQTSTLTNVNGCDSIVTTNVIADPIYNITENVSVCNGDSYTFPDGFTTTITSTTSHISNLTTTLGCDSIVTTNVTVDPTHNITENVNVCSGDPYTFPDGTTMGTITSPTIYISNLTTNNGCDSIVTTNVGINPTYNLTQNVDVCNGGSYTFPDGTVQSNITAPMTQISSLSTTLGCDSIITTNVGIITAYNTTVNNSICSGDSYTFPDGTTSSNITTQVTQVSNLISSIGCDSIVTTNLSVEFTYNLPENVSVCSGDPYTFPDGTVISNITTPTTHVNNLATIFGCDSIITTNVSVNPIYNITENVSVCNGDPYTFPDGTVMASIVTPVTYVSNLATTLGCDSIITTNVGVNQTYNLTENTNICNGNSYTFPDGTIQNNITSPTTHVSNLITTLGCDSVITTTVGVFPAYTNTSNFSVCNGDSFTFADGSTQNNITSPISYTSTLVSADGCDSLVTENIVVNPTYNQNQTINQCPGLGFTFPDGTVMNNINTNTTHVSNLSTTNGCDSIITTNINVYSVPPMDITFGPSGCPNLPMLMTNNTPGNDCYWEITGPTTQQTYTGCGSVVDTFYTAGQYDVTLTMVSNDGCPMDTTISNAFEVYPVPISLFTWDPNEGTITNNTINFTNTSIGGSSNIWDFGDSTTSTAFSDSHSYSDSGSYNVSLTVTNSYGCTDTSYGTVIINQEFFIFVPNSFTPDGDGFNNVFNPIVSGHNPDRYTLYIFDRWGELIFESHDSNYGWDGFYRGIMSKTDVYVWKVIVWTFDNKRKEFIGHVSLLR
jgi:gliding motility-associated-like protein